MNRSGPSPRSGFSLVEVTITMAIVLVLAGTANIYYLAILPEQQIGRAKTDIQQYKKAVGLLQSRYPGPLTSDAFRYYEDGPPWPTIGEGVPVEQILNPYHTGGPADEDPTLEKLLKFQIIPQLVEDPWGMPYRIDIQGGRIYSYGRDSEAGTDDDVADIFLTEFNVLRARVTASGRYLDLDFTRPMSRTVRDVRGRDLFKLNKSHFLVDSVDTKTTTAVIDFSSPYTVRLRLTQSTQDPELVTVLSVTASGSFLRSADGSVLTTPQIDLRKTGTSGPYYTPVQP